MDTAYHIILLSALCITAIEYALNRSVIHSIWEELTINIWQDLAKTSEFIFTGCVVLLVATLIVLVTNIFLTPTTKSRHCNIDKHLQMKNNVLILLNSRKKRTTQKHTMYYTLRRVCYIILMILFTGALIENTLSSKIYTEYEEAIENIYMKFTEEIKNIYKMCEENNKLDNVCGITLLPWTTMFLTFSATIITCFFIIDPITRGICYVIRRCFGCIIMSNSYNHTGKFSQSKSASDKYYVLSDDLFN
ncbi:uncharacterized protein [Linepithema humile]|uniref:uncharacterized protein n=1 Tax=Linepithema humile TaxID=83485 RepID=UPI00351F6938